MIGRIEGDDVQVKSKTNVGVETDAAPTVVASGSDVTVGSGNALLVLEEQGTSGRISICGPAHFTLLKSAGAVTIALDYGRLHPSLSSPEPLTIYTPMIVATPVAISGAERDTTLGLDQNGEMCIRTAHGAMRVEQQLSAESMIVPQGGVVRFVGGQMETLGGDASSSCSCELPKNWATRHASTQLEISALQRPLPQERKLPDATAPRISPREEPVYTVLMPPLSFDASALPPAVNPVPEAAGTASGGSKPSPAAQPMPELVPPIPGRSVERYPERNPEPSPEVILLVRETRVRPSAVYRGHVSPLPVVTPAVTAVGTKQDDHVAAPANPSAPSPPGLFARVRSFFRKMTGATP